VFRRPVFVVGFLLGFPVVAAAQAQSPNQPSVNFHVVTYFSVPKTELHASLEAQASGKNPADSAETVNSVVSWAQKQLHSVPGITWHSAGYSTERNGQKDANWRVSETLEVQSRNPAALLPLLGTLQSRLNLVDMYYTASAKDTGMALREAELRGLRRYRKEARQNCQALGYERMRLGPTFIDVNTTPWRPVPVMTMAEKTVPGPVIGQAGSKIGQVVVGGNAYCQERSPSRQGRNSPDS